MRPAVFATLFLSVLAACGTSSEFTPVTVQWMDWPAEVNAGQPFRTRLVVWGVCALNPRFRPGASADQSAVTFAPSFQVEDDRILCAGATRDAFALAAVDTAGTAPGLAASSARTYEMRASTSAFAFDLQGAGGLPNRTFGDVTVRPSGADPSRRNAAGYVLTERDSLKCVRLRPLGVYAPDKLLVSDNQADTSVVSLTFVRGYIYDAVAPICGEARVFHVVARE